jgi:Flp pilus assembly pilin Flp
MTLRDYIDQIRIFARRQEGQTMAEYGVVLAVITLLVIGVLAALSTAIQTKIGAVVTALGGTLPSS